MQRNWCGLGSKTRAITHRSGQGTEDARCTKITQDVVAYLISEEIPHRLSAEDVDSVPAKKALAQQIPTVFRRKRARRELALFA